MSTPKKTSGRAVLLVAILCQEDEDKFTETVNSCCTALHFSGIGNGTATNNYLSYFGFRDIEKRVVYSLVPDACLPRLLPAVSKALRLSRAGRGIAFTMPLTSISGILHNAVFSGLEKSEIGSQKRYLISSEKAVAKTERKEKAMHELVVAVVNQKYTDTAIEAARSAGATGATLFHTRSLDNAKAEQKIGTAFRQETDTLFFLTTTEYRNSIMQAVRDAAGLKTEGGAALFSLPVDEVCGIGNEEE